MHFDRRRFLGFGTAALALSVLPRFALAATGVSDTRLLVLLLRGGLDGLHALPAVGDSAYAALRGRLLDTPGQPPLLRLNRDFSLHGALEFMAGLYAQGQFSPVLAIAPPYRQRSHFDAQDCVENGTLGAGEGSGWMNRCVAAMPGSKGLALATVMPLAMRGGGNVATWSPPLPEGVDPILWQRLQQLYAADATLGPVFAGIDTDTPAGDAGSIGTVARGQRLPLSMAAAARFMSAPEGPRLGFVEDTGWDTHANQVGVLGRKLTELDAGLRAFHAGSGAIWPRTVVVIVSEFGRTAAVNGTGGTDHGTGGVAMLAGGAVAGGRVLGDWPGLSPAQLNDARDVRATTDLRALFKGVLRDHLGVPEPALARQVFPDSAAILPMAGLLRTA